MCIYSDTPYEWDRRKALLNRRRHGVAFADAVAVFHDPCAITVKKGATPTERRQYEVGP